MASGTEEFRSYNQVALSTAAGAIEPPCQQCYAHSRMLSSA
jgi:hypothetical protein